MNATLDPSFPAIPSGALLIWADTRQLYAAFPMTSGGTHIVAFPRSTLGLSKLLSLIAPPQDTSGTPAMAPKRPSLRPQAEAILQRMKLV